MPPPTAATSQPQTPAQQNWQLIQAAALVLATEVTVPAAAGALTLLFMRYKISRLALRGALEVVMAMPPEQFGFHGPATAAITRLNLLRRAQFLVNAARRITADLTAARSRNQPLAEALRLAVARERRFYGQHLQAIWSRMQAAARVDSAAQELGLLLGWYAVRDSHTTAECLAADGKNFWADQMPAIGYPGMVHLHCRCLPGRAHPGARLVGETRSGRVLAASNTY